MAFQTCALEGEYCRLETLSTVVFAPTDWDRVSTNNTVTIISSGNVFCSIETFNRNPFYDTKRCYSMPCIGTECPSIESITQSASPKLSAFSDLWPWSPQDSMSIGASLTLLLSVGFIWRAVIKALENNERSYHEND